MPNALRGFKSKYAGGNWAILIRSLKAAATMDLLTKFLFGFLAMAVIQRTTIGSPNYGGNPACNVECQSGGIKDCPPGCACVLRNNETRGRCADTNIPGFENITDLPPEYAH
uniref:Basic tail secreted protein n=1 Tax=Rhipicephalus appendiculatus TaxID=34631 RepID=A0A131Z5W3_RHIAP